MDLIIAMSSWLVSLPFPVWAEARFPVEKGDNWMKIIVDDLKLLVPRQEALSTLQAGVVPSCRELVRG